MRDRNVQEGRGLTRHTLADPINGSRRIGAPTTLGMQSMCRTANLNSLPEPADSRVSVGSVTAYAFGSATADVRIAILPDIYGCSPFYRGLATRYAEHGACAFLVDTFAEHGDLAEATREAAFARRHQVRDKSFLDRFERFVTDERITGVAGFCLGGFYVFELARRNVEPALVGLYGFPQGMPNPDPLPVPFDYLPAVSKPFTMMMGAEDHAVGADVIARLERAAPDAPAMDLLVYQGVGHNFLALLDSADPALAAIACDALARMDERLLGPAPKDGAA